MLIDYISGKTSGIPDCCILFFIRETLFAVEVGRVVHKRRRPTDDYDCGVGYVQCDYCYGEEVAVELLHNTAWDKALRFIVMPFIKVIY
jgi:hypothetical protein